MLNWPASSLNTTVSRRNSCAWMLPEIAPSVAMVTGLGRDGQGSEAQAFELRRPGSLVEEDRLRLCGQSGDQGRG